MCSTCRQARCGDAALQYRDIVIAETGQPLRRARRKALAIIHHHDRRRPARDQIGGAQFKTAERIVRREQKMPLAESALLAQVEQGQFAPALHRGAAQRLSDALFQRRSCDLAAHSAIPITVYSAFKGG